MDKRCRASLRALTQIANSEGTHDCKGGMKNQDDSDKPLQN